MWSIIDQSITWISIQSFPTVFRKLFYCQSERLQFICYRNRIEFGCPDWRFTDTLSHWGPYRVYLFSRQNKWSSVQSKDTCTLISSSYLESITYRYSIIINLFLVKNFRTWFYSRSRLMWSLRARQSQSLITLTFR